MRPAIVREEGIDVATQEKRGAGGRPAAAQKGEVDIRLLDAATRLFLSVGYDATSCDQVALDARAGKASIYARYANKTELFTAVIESNLARLFADQPATDLPGQPLRARMAAAGQSVMEQALSADAVALVRLLVAEAPRLQQVSLGADDMLARTGVRRVAAAIAAGDADPATLARAAALAVRLIDLILAPALLRALLGEDPAALLQAAPATIDDATAMLAAAGALDGWE